MVSQARESADIVVNEEPTLTPTCPHCEQTLTSIGARQVDARGRAAFGFGKRFVYACPNCNRLLGISHRKGFWMG